MDADQAAGPASAQNAAVSSQLGAAGQEPCSDMWLEQYDSEHTWWPGVVKLDSIRTGPLGTETLKRCTFRYTEAIPPSASRIAWQLYLHSWRESQLDVGSLLPRSEAQ